MLLYCTQLDYNGVETYAIGSRQCMREDYTMGYQNPL